QRADLAGVEAVEKPYGVDLLLRWRANEVHVNFLLLTISTIYLIKSTNSTKKNRPGGAGAAGLMNRDLCALPQFRREALDAPAGLPEQRLRGGVGNAEIGSKAEGSPVDDGHALCFQELRDKILVVFDHLAGRRLPADDAGTGRIDVERALRRGAVDSPRLVEHGDHEVATRLEDRLVARDAILRAGKRLDRRPER